MTSRIFARMSESMMWPRTSTVSLALTRPVWPSRARGVMHVGSGEGGDWVRKIRMVLAALSLGAFVGWTPPAHALYCASELDAACRLVFGTYCKVTKRSSCFP